MPRDEGATEDRRRQVALQALTAAERLLEEHVQRLAQAGQYGAVAINLKAVNGILSLEVVQSQSSRWDV
jgi:hypothetical protein